MERRFIEEVLLLRAHPGGEVHRGIAAAIRDVAMRTVGRQVGAGPLGQRRAGVGGINQTRRASTRWVATYEAALDEGGDLILRTTGHGGLAIELGVRQAQRKIGLA